MTSFVVKADVFFNRTLTFKVEAEDAEEAALLVEDGKVTPQDWLIEVDVTKCLGDVEVVEVVDALTGKECEW